MQVVDPAAGGTARPAAVPAGDEPGAQRRRTEAFVSSSTRRPPSPGDADAEGRARSVRGPPQERLDAHIGVVAEEEVHGLHEQIDYSVLDNVEELDYYNK